MKQQHHQQLKILESLRNALERKAADFDNARQRSVEAAKMGIHDLRTLTDFVESSIIREIEEAFEVNRFAAALDVLNDNYYDERDNTEDTDLSPEVEKLRELALEDAAPQLGPSKRDFLKAQEMIISLNNWYSKRPLHLPERIEGRCVGGDSVEVVWGKVEGAVCYHVEQRRPSEGAFLRVYEGVETRYRVDGLCAGARVLFRVRSVMGSGGVSEWSECVEASTPAAAPQYLCAKGLSSSEIAVVWDKADVPCGDFNNIGDEGDIAPTYHVEMRPRNNTNVNGDRCGFKEIYSGSETRCTASGLESEEEYAFRVRTMAGGRCISMSGAVCGRTSIARPRKLRVRTDSWDAINLSWDCVVSKSGEAVCYVVEMKEGGVDGDGGEFTEIYRGARNKVRKTEFKHNAEYSFRVRAVVRDEVSEWSDVVSVKTQRIPAPSNFTATTERWDTVTLKWDSVVSATGEAVNYIVGMKENGHTRFTEVYKGTETSFIQTDFEHNTEYSFRVRSVCKSGGSEWSDTVSVKIQSIPIPSNFTATTRSWGSVYLSWDSVTSKAGEAVGYAVAMKSERDSKFTEIYRGTKTNFTKTELKQDTEYSFWVRTMHKNRMSEWSSAASVKTQKLFAPSNFKVTSIKSDSITLTWDKVSDASFYQVEVDGAIQSDQIKSNSFVKGGLLPETEHSFRVRSMRGSEISEWGDIVEGKTRKASFDESAWKKCPCSVDKNRKYNVDNKNSRIVTKVDDRHKYNLCKKISRSIAKIEVRDCTIIGNTPIPLNTVTSWTIKVLKSTNTGKGIYVGVAPSDINQDNNNNNHKECGWYFSCSDSKLCSGPPHNYISREYGLKKGFRLNFCSRDSVGVVMDTFKGELSFILNGVNLGVAYEEIPIDKPLVPCVILACGGDSIELDNPEVRENKVKTFVPAPFDITINNITWDSITLTWNDTKKAAFYQIEVDESSFWDASTTNTFTKRGFLPETEHSFRVRAVRGSEMSEWSCVVKGRTHKAPFASSVWKKCPDYVDWDKKYSMDERDSRITTKINNGFCTTTGNAYIPINAVTSWNIKIHKSMNNNGASIYVGVAPSDINQNTDKNYNKCGWYFSCYDSTLYSGPPHNYSGKEYGPSKEIGQNVHTGDSVGVVVNTTKGELSFVLDGVNHGIAYEGIPLDKPLVPCVLLYFSCDSVELDTSEVKDNTSSYISIPSDITTKSITWDSITLTWDKVVDASFYQVEVDGNKSWNVSTINTFTEGRLLPETVHSFRVRTVRGSLVSEWSGVVEGRTLKESFETSGWKECPERVCKNKYIVNKDNLQIATKINNGGYCTIIGCTYIPINRVTTWSIRALKSKENNGEDIFIGVAPYDISQDINDNCYKYGWYFDCYSSTLISGPPHNYWNKEYGTKKGPGEYVHTGDSVGVVIDTTKGELSFVLNNVNLSVAYEGIPLDKPLVPCVILLCDGDSVGLLPGLHFSPKETAHKMDTRSAIL